MLTACSKSLSEFIEQVLSVLNSESGGIHLQYMICLFVLCSAELDAEHAQKVLDMEHTQQMKLKERQKFFEEAFQQDMEQYLSTGYLQIAERRGKL